MYEDRRALRCFSIRSAKRFVDECLDLPAFVLCQSADSRQDGGVALGSEFFPGHGNFPFSFYHSIMTNHENFKKKGCVGVRWCRR